MLIELPGIRKTIDITEWLIYQVAKVKDFFVALYVVSIYARWITSSRFKESTFMIHCWKHHIVEYTSKIHTHVYTHTDK